MEIIAIGVVARAFGRLRQSTFKAIYQITELVFNFRLLAGNQYESRVIPYMYSNLDMARAFDTTDWCNLLRDLYDVLDTD